jgi:hypothetical protein
VVRHQDVGVQVEPRVSAGQSLQMPFDQLTHGSERHALVAYRAQDRGPAPRAEGQEVRPRRCVVESR